MGFSITSNYAGEHAGQYIAAALKSAKSLEYLTVLENVKFKRNITKVATSGLIVDATCDFSDAGTVTLTERVLNPKELQINVDLCKKDLLADWQAGQMTGGAHNRGMSNDFTAFLFSHLSAAIADHIEDRIWTGNDGDPGSFTGFMTVGGVGTVDADAAVVEVTNTAGAGAAYTVANMDNDLTLIVNAIPNGMYGKEDVYIYMNSKTYRLYMENQAANQNLAWNMGDNFQPMYNGIKIAVCPGIADDQMLCAQKSNLFFGTDLMSDTTQIKVLDMGDLDGSDNIRVVAKFTAGVQHAQGGDIVRCD